MINTPYEKEFVFHDGQRAKNILELSVIIERLSQQDFERFVNPSKNDFANWIEYVLLDKELASALRSTILSTKTKEFLNKKLALENASTSSINSASINLQKKRSLFNIFKQEPKTHVVELKKPIEKLPEPEHHIIQKIPGAKNDAVIKRRWFSKKETSKESTHDSRQDSTYDYTDGKINSQENSQAYSASNTDSHTKKDNALRKWYEFKKKERKEKHKRKESNSRKEIHEDSDSGNIFWILIYGAVIFLIVALIIYKFVLKF